MHLDTDTHPVTAVVLAGDRTKNDPLIAHSNVAGKAQIEIDGVPMVRRVLDTLRQSSAVSKIVLAGPASDVVAQDKAIGDLVGSDDVQWRPPEASPSASAFHAMQSLESSEPVLLTTADHPLLTREIVDAFVRQSLADDVDVAVGMVPYALIAEAYPGIKKTVFKFSDGEFCGCNLYAFLTPEGRQVASFWRRIEQQRKKPLVLIGMLGWLTVLRFRMGLLSLDAALSMLGKRLGLRMRAVILPYPNAAIDVDSIADLALVRGIVSKNRAQVLPVNAESDPGTADPIR